ncbi:hypothetical protein L7F22_007860 [Adiantum nelumboides]|nr:hypothetical protein [Adiantum nelumboides]
MGKEPLGPPRRTMPKLKSEAKSSGVGLAINLDSRSSLGADRATEAEFATGKSPWEDDDTRRFYEDLTDLRDLVPPSLLGEKAGAEPADPLQASAAADAVPSTKESKRAQKSAR